MKHPSKLPPLLTAAALLTAYLAWFLAPIFFVDPKSSAVAPAGFDAIYNAGIGEVIVAVVLLLLVGMLGWWKFIGLKASNAGGLKFVWLPLLYTLLLIALAVGLARSNAIPLLEVFEYHQLALLLLISFLVGFNEETIFRGFLFQGLASRLGPFLTILLSGVLFGMFHLVNLITGQPLDTTLSQVAQAGSMGFMYAALRLRLGSIWPLILLHGFWDFSVSIMQQSAQMTGLEVGPQSGFHPAMGLPLFLYGLFVYWRWSVWKMP